MLVTSFIACVIIFLGVVLRDEPLKRVVAIDTSGHPTIGSKKASIQIVMFEDLQCQQCKIFNKTIFPDLKKNYIDTGIVNYTLITLPIIKGSELMVSAALAVYKETPQHFFPFIEKINKCGKGSRLKSDIVLKALEIQGINIQTVQGAISSQRSNADVYSNLLVAKKIMGEKVFIPALFVNGKLVFNLTYEKICNLIDQALEDQKEEIKGV